MNQRREDVGDGFGPGPQFRSRMLQFFGCGVKPWAGQTLDGIIRAISMPTA